MNDHDKMKHAIREEVKKQEGIRQKRGSGIFGIETDADVRRSIAGAVSIIELERKTDGSQRQQLADQIRKQGLKIEKEATQINGINDNLCQLSSLVGMEIEKLKIEQSISDEMFQIVDVLDNCGQHQTPVMLNDDQLETICGMYNSDFNCQKMKKYFKSITNCDVMEKYLLHDKIVIKLKLEIPKISDMDVSSITTVPIYHEDGGIYELEIQSHEYFISDKFTSQATSDCLQMQNLTYCEPNRKSDRKINACIASLTWNETISNCQYSKLMDDRNCFYKSIPGVGILVSNSEPLDLIKRKNKDDRRMNLARKSHPLQPGRRFKIPKNALY